MSDSTAGDPRLPPLHAEIERLLAALKRALYIIDNNPNALVSEVAIEIRAALAEEQVWEQGNDSELPTFEDVRGILRNEQKP